MRYICKEPDTNTNNDAHFDCLSSLDKEGSLGLFGPKGMGGVGKTTTAIAVARSDKIRQAFCAHNIWWITVGQEADDTEILSQFARKVSRHEY